MTGRESRCPCRRLWADHGRSGTNRLLLTEKSGLVGCILRVAEVAQPNPDEAKPLLWVQANTVSER